MHDFLITWLVNIAALYLVAALVADIKIKDFCSAALGALLLGMAAAVLQALFHWIHLPLLSLDICRFLLFAGLFWLVGTFTPGFKVSSPAGAVAGALLLMLIDWGMAVFAHLRLSIW